MTMSSNHPDPALAHDQQLVSRLERRRRLRGRNLATLAALLALVVLFYVITLTRMGGL